MYIDSMVRRTSYEAPRWRNCLSDTMENVCLFRGIISDSALDCRLPSHSISLYSISNKSCIFSSEALCSFECENLASEC